MSAVIFCDPEPQAASVSFSTGSASPCGVENQGEPEFCPELQVLDGFYAQIFWAVGGQDWFSRDIIWDLGLVGGGICKDLWPGYNLEPSDFWQNIQDHWSSLGTY